MGEEASKRGYEIKPGKTRLTTRTLAIFHRKKGEVSQSFYITEDLLKTGVIYLDCTNRVAAKYDNEESFKKSIELFNKYLLYEGYSNMEEEVNTPFFSKEDSDYVRDNYEELAKIFFTSKQINVENIEVNDSLAVIIDEIKKCFLEEWTTIKAELLVLAGALTFLLTNSGYPIYIKEKKNMSSFYLEREEGLNCFISNSPLDLIYASYRVKSVDKIMVPILKRYFTKDELKLLGI